MGKYWNLEFPHDVDYLCNTSRIQYFNHPILKLPMLLMAPRWIELMTVLLVTRQQQHPV